MSNYYPIDEDYFGVESAQDCTGLIPARLTEDELTEYYEEMYPYLAPADEDYYTD